MAVSEAEKIAYAECPLPIHVFDNFSAAQKAFEEACTIYAAHPAPELNGFLATSAVLLADCFTQAVGTLGALEPDIDARETAVYTLMHGDDSKRTKLLCSLTEPDAFITREEAAQATKSEGTDVLTLQDEIARTLRNGDTWQETTTQLGGFYLDTLKREVNTFAILSLTRKPLERAIRREHMRAASKHVLATLGVLGGSAAIGISIAKRLR